MISVDIKTIGGPEVAQRLKDADSGIRAELRAELAEIGDEMVATAQAKAPKRTGILASKIVWYFGREYKRGPKGHKVMRVVDSNFKDAHIEFTFRPRGRVAHLMERGVNASFHQRPGKRGRDKQRRGQAAIGPYAGEVQHGPDWRYARTLKIAPRPFFWPAVESVGGAAGVNARLQTALDRVAAGRVA